MTSTINTTVFPSDKSSLDPDDVGHGEQGNIYPQINRTCLIVGNCFKYGAIEMLARTGCASAENIDDAEFILFLGGEDIDPSFYGQERCPGTYTNERRDSFEAMIYHQAKDLGIPMVGICRGMQLIHALAGGQLYQDVDNHGRPHLIHAKESLDDTEMALQLLSSSMHHQMCIPFDGCEPVAFAQSVGTRYTVGPNLKSGGSPVVNIKSTHLDLEAAIYPEILGVATQGHPEVGGTSDYTCWFMNIVAEFLDGVDAAKLDFSMKGAS